MVWGVLFFDFPSSSTFPRGGGLFVLISLDGKCHGLVHDGKFSFEGFLYCNESIRSKSYMWTPEIPSFSHLSLFASRTLTTPAVWFPVSLEAPSFVCSETPLFTRWVVSCCLARAPVSLWVSSYLPALANPQRYMFSEPITGSNFKLEQRSNAKGIKNNSLSTALFRSWVCFFFFFLSFILDCSWFGGFPGGSDGKESACSAGDLGSNPGLARPPGKRMATHSGKLAWRIPWTEKLGRL